MKGAKNPEGLFVLYLTFGILIFISRNDLVKLKLESSLFLPLLACFAWCWLSLINNAPMDLFFVSFSRGFLYLLYAIILLRYLDQKNVSLVALIIILGGFLESLYLLFLANDPGATGGYLFGNPSYSALLISSGICFLIAFLDSKYLSKKKFLYLLIPLVIFGAALFETGSRATMLGLLFALLIMPKRKKTFLALGGIFLFLCLIFMLFPSYLFKLIEINPDSLMETVHEYYLGRWVIWKTGIYALLDKWLVGFGLGNFESAYMLHQQPSAEILRYAKVTQYAHNDWLHLAATAGLPALIFIGWATLNFFKETHDENKNSNTVIRRGAKGTIVLFLVSSLFNFNFYLPLNGMLFTSCLVMVIRSSRIRKLKKIPIKSLTLSFASIWVLLTTFLFLYSSSSYALQKKKYAISVKLLPIRADVWADYSEHSEFPKNKHEYLRRSLIWNPNQPFVWSRLSSIIFSVNPNQKSDIQTAIQYAQLLHPKHSPFYIREAQYQLQWGNIEKALELLEKSSQLEPRAPLPFYYRGIIKSKLGKIQDSIKDLEASLNLKNTYESKVLPSEYAKFLFAVDSNNIENSLSRLKKGEN